MLNSQKDFFARWYHMVLLEGQSEGRMVEGPNFYPFASSSYVGKNFDNETWPFSVTELHCRTK